ncbi:MAG TPA: ABC-F family ATP-binding cassette domain-containing protein [Verrucomicrobiota bacterium]|nr:ABC transporter ATP-binding protein [Verrucomicrobiales bacterium]HRI16570.1 ABC-F family ATP-binding cassette domain-containing protein [Verrucomicrobiota bacterium]
MFTLAEVSKSYGGKTLFEDVTLTINREDRLGLVGPNGAGKSTLFKLILGHEETTSGQILSQRGATVGFLPQENAPVGEETVLELATSHLHGDEFGTFDGSLVASAKRILKGLSFRDADYDRPARTLSGGWVMRAHLARLLVQAPDLLMLDEPTNHLDLETLLWFQEYLETYPGGIVLISHDREFLNHLVTGILELRNGQLFSYSGNYESFLEQRAAREQQQLSAFKNQQREIARLQEFADRFRAKASKASQAQAKLKQIARMERIDAPEAAAATVDFSFPQPESSGQRVMTLRGVDFAYGDHVVYRALDYQAEKGERTVLVGPNGAGKSTLLKLLAGVLKPQGGERDPGLRVKIGYFSQYRSEMLDPSRTVLEEVFDTPRLIRETDVRALLGCFLFREDDVKKRVKVLSGGEKSRLALVKLLLDPPNFLLMDEPTTHLDMGSIEAVIAALTDFSGTLIFISHDVYFIRALATKVVHVNAGRLTPYAGGYDYYLEKSRATSARVALTAGLQNGRPVEPNRPPAPNPEQQRRDQRSQKERREQAADARRELGAQRRQVATLETDIMRLEERQSALSSELQKPETYTTPGRTVAVNTELKTIQNELSAKINAWEAAAARLSVMEASAT